MFEQKDNKHLERVKLKTLMEQLKNVHRFLKTCYEKSVREENSDELQRVIYIVLKKNVKLSSEATNFIQQLQAGN